MTDEHQDKMERWMASMELDRQKTEEWLKTQPQSKACEKHPDISTEMVVGRCYRDKAVYADCPSCVAEEKAKERILHLLRHGIPEDATHATLANFDVRRGKVNANFQTPESFLEAANKFDRGEIRNLVLAGNPGIGKGHLASAIGIGRLDAGKTVVWGTCFGLFHEFHKAYETNKTESVIWDYAGPSLLVLDEICLRELPKDGEEILFSIFEYRHKHKLQSILLGNKAADDTRAWLGGRILDRLRSGGLSFRYGEWKSMRGTAGDGSQFQADL